MSIFDEVPKIINSKNSYITKYITSGNRTLTKENRICGQLKKGDVQLARQFITELKLKL